MSDSAELKGYMINWVTVGGKSMTLNVSSSPVLNDTDSDGIDDGQERSLLLNPSSKDTDGDGLYDIDELYSYPSEVLDGDTDGDGLSDGVEINGWELSTFKVVGGSFDETGKVLEEPIVVKSEPILVHSDPTLVDSDFDGLTDFEELQPVNNETVSNPMVTDSDGDGLADNIDPTPLMTEFQPPEITSQTIEFDYEVKALTDINPYPITDTFKLSEIINDITTSEIWNIIEDDPYSSWDSASWLSNLQALLKDKIITYLDTQTSYKYDENTVSLQIDSVTFDIVQSWFDQAGSELLSSVETFISTDNYATLWNNLKTFFEDHWTEIGLAFIKLVYDLVNGSFDIKKDIPDDLKDEFLQIFKDFAEGFVNQWGSSFVGASLKLKDFSFISFDSFDFDVTWKKCKHLNVQYACGVESIDFSGKFNFNYKKKLPSGVSSGFDISGIFDAIRNILVEEIVDLFTPTLSVDFSIADNVGIKSVEIFIDTGNGNGFNEFVSQSFGNTGIYPKTLDFSVTDSIDLGYSVSGSIFDFGNSNFKIIITDINGNIRIVTGELKNIIADLTSDFVTNILKSWGIDPDTLNYYYDLLLQLGDSAKEGYYQFTHDVSSAVQTVVDGANQAFEYVWEEFVINFISDKIEANYDQAVKLIESSNSFLSPYFDSIKSGLRNSMFSDFMNNTVNQVSDIFGGFEENVIGPIGDFSSKIQNMLEGPLKVLGLASQIVEAVQKIGQKAIEILTTTITRIFTSRLNKIANQIINNDFVSQFFDLLDSSQSLEIFDELKNLYSNPLEFPGSSVFNLNNFITPINNVLSLLSSLDSIYPKLVNYISGDNSVWSVVDLIVSGDSQTRGTGVNFQVVYIAPLLALLLSIMNLFGINSDEVLTALNYSKQPLAMKLDTNNREKTLLIYNIGLFVFNIIEEGWEFFKESEIFSKMKAPEKNGNRMLKSILDVIAIGINEAKAIFRIPADEYSLVRINNIHEYYWRELLYRLATNLFDSKVDLIIEKTNIFGTFGQTPNREKRHPIWIKAFVYKVLKILTTSMKGLLDLGELLTMIENGSIAEILALAVGCFDDVRDVIGDVFDAIALLQIADSSTITDPEIRDLLLNNPNKAKFSDYFYNSDKINDPNKFYSSFAYSIVKVIAEGYLLYIEN